jgi:hypothetical protein
MQLYLDHQNIQPINIPDIHCSTGTVSTRLVYRPGLPLPRQSRASCRSPGLEKSPLEAIFEPEASGNLAARAKEILDLCWGFMERDLQTAEVRLSHFTVKEFLNGRSEHQAERAHATIAKMCVPHVESFLSRCRRDKEHRWEIGHFLCYALTPLSQQMSRTYAQTQDFEEMLVS